MHTWALVAVCVVAGILYVATIGASGRVDAFYSAGVRSMSQSFTNFLFGSYDPVGVVTIDKPPLAFWPQVVSVWIFGYHDWAQLLPQVVEGVATVFLFHRTVRLWAGPDVALLAAFLLAITPVTVALDRANKPDTLLILLLVAAAYALTRSVRAASSRGRTTWLLWCAFFVGCGFVSKLLEAWVVVPGLALAFLCGVDGPVKRRILDLLAATAVLVVSSFWWIALHDLWPGAPYMGGSTNGTALDLALGYNGFGRLLDPVAPAPGTPAVGSAGYGVFLTMFGGAPGIGRLFNSTVGGQISWLLPLALLTLVGVVIGAVRGRRTGVPGDPQRRAGWVMWGSWLLVTGVVFSYTQGIWHAYYTALLAPAITAIAAMGLTLLWGYYRRPDGVAWTLLPLAVVVTVVWALVLDSRVDAFDAWTRWVVLVAAVLGVAGLVVARVAPPRRWTRVAVPALVVAVLSAVLTPTAWAASPTNGGNNPAAGPGGNPFAALAAHRPSGGRAGAVSSSAPPPGWGRAQLTPVDRQILTYAAQHSGTAQITLAIEGGSLNASRFVINADQPVIGLGGFSGADDVPSVDQLQQWVTTGRLKFVLASGVSPAFAAMSALGGPAEDGRVAWVAAHCTVVDPHEYGATSAPQALYSCQPGAGAAAAPRQPR